MKTFYVDFSCWTIEAENEHEAIKKAEQILLKENKHPLIVNCEPTSNSQLPNDEIGEAQSIECYEE